MVAERFFVVSISILERWFTYSLVNFFTVVGEICRDRGFVQNIWCSALTRHGAFVGVLAIAISRGQWLCFFQDLLVVGVDAGLHAWHASVTNFNCLAIEYFVQRVVRREMEIQESKKFFSHVRFDGVAEWGVKPYDFPTSVSSPSLVATGFVTKSVVVS